MEEEPNAQIVFTGLCGFNNMNGANEEIIGPSVILVRTDTNGDGGHGGHEGHAGHEGHGEHEAHPNGGPAMNHEHIPFLAYNIARAAVDDPTDFSPVKRAEHFHYIKLDGVELVLDNDPEGQPEIAPSYDQLVVKRDDYWPQETGNYDPDFVPAAGGKPDKKAVVAFMSFGGGRISAERPCPFKWEFKDGEATIVKDHFAEEVIYSFRRDNENENEVVIRLLDIETGEERRRLAFRPLAETGMLTLVVGNNMVDDMDNSVDRRPPVVIENRDHFVFLNQTAGKGKNGPLPKAVDGPPPAPRGGGGGIGGVCGPINTNGKPKP